MPPVARAAPDDDGEASLAPTARRPPVGVPAGVQRLQRSGGRRHLHQTPRPSTSWCRPSRAPSASCAPRTPARLLYCGQQRSKGRRRRRRRPYGRRAVAPVRVLRGSRRSRRSSQRREAQGEVTVLEHRLAALAREKGRVAAPRPPPRAPRGAYDEWRRGMESDVRACVERIEEIGARRSRGVMLAGFFLVARPRFLPGCCRRSLRFFLVSFGSWDVWERAGAHIGESARHWLSRHAKSRDKGRICAIKASFLLFSSSLAAAPPGDRIQRSNGNRRPANTSLDRPRIAQARSRVAANGQGVLDRFIAALIASRPIWESKDQIAGLRRHLPHEPLRVLQPGGDQQHKLHQAAAAAEPAKAADPVS